MHDQTFSLFSPKKNPRCITQIRFNELRTTVNLDMAHLQNIKPDTCILTQKVLKLG